MRLQRALARAKDIRALAVQDFPNKAATMPCLPHDLLDGRAALGLGGYGGVDLFAAEITLVLKPLRGG
jgi:hypothetical protein